MAPAAGVHNIVCTPAGYNYPPYEINMAASFYATNCNGVFNIANLTSTTSYISCQTGGSINCNIATTSPGSAIYANCEINEGQNNSYPITWTGGTSLGNAHVGNGIESSTAWASAPAVCTYSFTGQNNSPQHNGCGGLCLVLVAIPPPCAGCPGISLTDVHVNPTCGSNNGSITVTATGGTAPYTYVWTPNVSTTNMATGLSAGTYIITVNGVGCGSASDTVVLLGNTLAITTNIINPILCNGGLGSVDAVITLGGTPPFTYSWSTIPIQTNAAATGLTAGTYTVTVNDAGGCTSTASINLTEPAALSTVTSVGVASCGGLSGGSATVTVGGGTPGYTYSWLPNGGNGPNATGLSAGTYTINVADANGCTTSTTVTVANVPVPTVTVNTVSDITCFGLGNGNITTTTAGGTFPYTYAWTPVGGVGPNASNLSAGCYTLTVTDANGCVATASACITEPQQLIISPIPPQTICIGQTATITPTVNGGTLPYTYAWSDTIYYQ